MSSQISTQEAIQRVAAGIDTLTFIPAVHPDYEPRKGTLMRWMWSHRKLTLRQQKAWKLFTSDLHRAAGKSGAVGSAYREAVTSGDPGGHRIPLAFTNASYRRVNRDRLRSMLTRGETLLLEALIAQEYQPDDALDAISIGGHFRGHRDEAMARAAGEAIIATLLDRIALLYTP